MLIFHHIPKTAGTSFVHLLQQNYTEQELLLSYGDKENPSRWWRDFYRALPEEERRRIRCVASHSANRLIPVLLDEGAPFQAVTLLRDPVERCVSLYYYVLELARAGEQQAGGRTGRFLLDSGWSLDDVYRRAGEAPEALSAFFDGQAQSLVRPWGLTLDRSSAPPSPALRARLDEAMRHYDVGLVEDYDRAIDRWAARFAWRHVSYEARNVTRSRARAPAVSDETRALVRAHNQVDLYVYDSFAAPARKP